MMAFLWNFLTSSCILGSVWVENTKKSKLLCFSSNLLEICYRGNLEMVITKKARIETRKPFDKKMQFSIDSSQNYAKLSSRIAFTWQQWMSDGTSLHLEWKLTRYSKSQSLSFLLLTVSAQRREDPGCGWSPPLPTFGLLMVKLNTWKVGVNSTKKTGINPQK